MASIVPVIVNAILNEHQIVVDIVAFVNKGDFPRSRLGEKQRGKILASWVTRKMRTMAQFGIRDAESGLSDVNEGVEPRMGVSSVRNGSVIASSLRNVELAPQLLEQNEANERRESYTRYSPPPGVAEMPANDYRDMLVTSPTQWDDGTIRSDNTPTEARPGNSKYPPVTSVGSGLDLDFLGRKDKEISEYASSLRSPTLPSVDSLGRQPSPMPPAPGPKPAAYAPVPAVEADRADIWSLPSQRPDSRAGAGGGGMLKVANPTEDEEDWGHEAIMHMNLAGHRNVS